MECARARIQRGLPLPARIPTQGVRKDGKTHPAGPDGRTIRDGLDPLRAICRMAELLAGRLASPGIEQAPVPAKLVLRSPEPSEHVRPGEIENVLKRPTDRDVYIRRRDPLGLGLSRLRVGGDIRRAEQAGIVEAAARPTRPLTCQDVKGRASLERQGNV